MSLTGFAAIRQDGLEPAPDAPTPGVDGGSGGLSVRLGANTATFSVLNASCCGHWRSGRRPRGEVRENLAAPEEGDLRSLGAANYGAWRAGQRVFTGIAAGTGTSLIPPAATTPSASGRQDQRQLLPGARYPAAGVATSPLTDRPPEPRVLLSYDVWQRQLGGDPPSSATR
jgi:hypothetical protein